METSLTHDARSPRRSAGVRAIAADVLDAGVVAPAASRSYLEGPALNPAVIEGQVAFVRDGIEILRIPYVDRERTAIDRNDELALVSWCHRNGQDLGYDDARSEATA
jgi:hypothetical protein